MRSRVDVTTCLSKHLSQPVGYLAGVIVMDDPDSGVPRGRARRVAPLVGLAGRTAGEAVVASLRARWAGEHEAARARGEFHRRVADQWAHRLGSSRGVLMKAGQILSVVLPDSGVESGYRGIYQAALAKLQDNAPPMPAAVVTEVITAELGRPPSELFAEFDPRPVAAASIGQVHAATLPDGRKVAVKVQYPGVDEAIRADLANTELLATFFRLLVTLMPNLTKLDVRAMAREISERIGEEIDYQTEAANQRLFADVYRGHPFIHIPEVHDEWSTRRVLTMDFVDGQRYAKATMAEQDLRDRWSEVIFRFYLGSMYNFGLVHTDAHPGNYLFHPDGTVTFLDFGCVKQLSTDRVAGMSSWFQPTLDGDVEAVWRAAAKSGYVDPTDPADPVELLAWFRDAYRYIVGPQPFTITPRYVADAMRDRISATSPHRRVIGKMTMDSDVTMALRMDIAVIAALGGLRPNGQWRAICQEWVDAAPPTTTYGQLAATFAAAHFSRGGS
jgi:predicted unusual protein kinase regulating ubiquinone biosynthesis (AarF/ABC1/UbiB family)